MKLGAGCSGPIRVSKHLFNLLGKFFKGLKEEVPLITASVSFWAQICTEPPDMKDNSYNIFVLSSGNDLGWTVMDSLRAQINPSVSALSPLNFSVSAAFIVGFEEDKLEGMICWAAATVALEAACTRLFWELTGWF